MIGKILGTIFGGAISVLSAIGIWKLVEMITNGVYNQNWLQVIAGGILTWVFLGILVVIFVGGIIIIAIS